MKTTIKNSIHYIITDAKNRPWFLLLETVCTILGISAATTLAIHNQDANFIFVWSANLASSVGLSFIGYKRESTNIMVLMGIYSFINICGLVNTLISLTI